MILEKIKTGEEMINYIITYISDTRLMLNKNSREYSVYSEIISDLRILKERYLRRNEIPIELSIRGFKMDGDKAMGMVTTNGFTLQFLDDKGNPLPIDKEYIERFCKKGENK